MTTPSVHSDNVPEETPKVESSCSETPSSSAAAQVPRGAFEIDGSRPARLVSEFHAIYGMPDRIASGQPSGLDYERLGMRMSLISEEVTELMTAVYGPRAGEVIAEAFASAPDDHERDIVETADALADLVYVIYGMALESGIDLDAVLAEVHSSNLSKLMPDGSVRRREDGKILKGPNFREPEIKTVIAARDALVGNPLLTPSDLPFGVPDFARIKIKHLEPAIRQGVHLEKEAWEKIASNPDEPTVENTVVAVDAAGDLLERASAVFFTLESSIGGEELDKLQEELAPLLAAHFDDFNTDTRMYQRYKHVATLPDLDPETAWLVDQTLHQFERSGVNLSAQDKKRLRELNQEIAGLEARIDTRIGRQLVVTHLTGDDLSQLDGLPESDLAAAEKAGEAVGAAWKLGVPNFSIPPQLAGLKDPETRRRLLDVSLHRGDGDAESETATGALIIELADLRAQRAKLLGFASHADLVMDEETVPSPVEARALLSTVGQAARDSLNKEADVYRQQAAEEQVKLTVADWSVYEERARQASLGVNADVLKEYFELSNVVEDGIFYAANQLYGLTFKERPDVVGWSEETRTWEVFGDDGHAVGLFMADYFRRSGKSGGAWMSSLESGCGRTGRLPVITNNCNFEKAPHGQPVLLSWDNVETVFHEFGHALHGLLSQTYYEETAGTNVPRDFVELPSQLNEMWAFHPQVLDHYARHWETGESLPEDVRDAIVDSKHFGQPYSTMEYVQSALIDQAWHAEGTSRPDSPEQIKEFENAILQEVGVDHCLVAPRYRSPYFAHSFDSGYDGAYYSYMWAEAMVAELEEWFRNEAAKDDGGLNREAGEKLRAELLSRGNSRDPLESFIAVKGRLPKVDAVVRRRGLGIIS